MPAILRAVFGAHAARASCERSSGAGESDRRRATCERQQAPGLRQIRRACRDSRRDVSCADRGPGARGTTGRTCAGSAPRARRPEVLRGAVDHPVELGQHLLGGRLGYAALARAHSKSHGLPSEPRASITAAAPVRAKHRTCPRIVQAAGEDHRRVQRVHQSRGERVVGNARGARRPSADAARSRATPASSTRRCASSKPAVVTAGATGAQLDRHRQWPACAVLPRSPPGGARERPPARRGRQSAAPAPVLQTFGTGQPMLRSITSAPAAATRAAAERMTPGSCPKSWIETDRPRPRRTRPARARAGRCAAARAACARCRSGSRKTETISETAIPAP